MRRGIDGLVSLVAESEMNVCDQGAVFLFCGRKKDRYKVLYWDPEGFTLSYRRLEAGKLQWPKSVDETEMEQITSKQLRWLTEGLSIHQPKAVKQAEIGHMI